MSILRSSSLLLGAALVVASGFFSLPLAAKAPAPDLITLRIEVDRPVLPADSAQRAIVKVALDAVRPPRAAERAPVNLVVVLDRSGSMSGAKIEQAREAAIEALRRLGPEDLFSLVAYDHEVATLIPPQPVRETAGLERQIRHLNARGNTALYAGVTQGVAELRKNLDRRGTVHRVLLLSDGQANVGPSSPDDLARLGAALLKEGISVSTVGLGDGYNEDLMARLAQRSDGNHYYVAESADLVQVFAAELGDVLDIVAKEVVVTVEFPAGIRPITTVGRSAEIRGQTIELPLNQLYGGQEKFLLVEVEVPARAVGATQDLARAAVRYREARSDARRSVAATAQVSFARDEAEVRRQANATVQADYAVNVVAAAKAEAVALSDSGRRDEAARVLASAGASLREVGSSYANAAVADQAAALTAEADVVGREGVAGARRKAYRAEEHKTVNQQQAPRSN